MTLIEPVLAAAHVNFMKHTKKDNKGYKEKLLYRVEHSRRNFSGKFE